VLEDYKRDPEGMKDKADQWKASRDIT
jgi:hypothetical protein